jgi:hypothetical protein
MSNNVSMMLSNTFFCYIHQINIVTSLKVLPVRKVLEKN